LISWARSNLERAVLLFLLDLDDWIEGNHDSGIKLWNVERGGCRYNHGRK